MIIWLTCFLIISNLYPMLKNTPIFFNFIIISIKVPRTTKPTIKITKPCIANGETRSVSPEYGLLLNIMLLSPQNYSILYISQSSRSSENASQLLEFSVFSHLFSNLCCGYLLSFFVKDYFFYLVPNAPSVANIGNIRY